MLVVVVLNIRRPENIRAPLKVVSSNLIADPLHSVKIKLKALHGNPSKTL